ncbi:JAB domain-containing protein [Alcaligenes aquatilis]|uniref:JAB domain-containing protein n=1 Tax=Alcaligenes aquatilis TaxID=323284 RepID=UPI0038780834
MAISGPPLNTSDIVITKRMQEALALIDIRVLDHIIVGWTVIPPFLAVARSRHAMRPWPTAVLG